MKHKLNPVLDAQLNRNRKVRGHRRNFSDGRITSSLTDNMADEVNTSALDWPFMKDRIYYFFF